jgi:hypothetical protein
LLSHNVQLVFRLRRNILLHLPIGSVGARLECDDVVQFVDWDGDVCLLLCE